MSASKTFTLNRHGTIHTLARPVSRLEEGLLHIKVEIKVCDSRDKDDNKSAFPANDIRYDDILESVRIDTKKGYDKYWPFGDIKEMIDYDKYKVISLQNGVVTLEYTLPILMKRTQQASIHFKPLRDLCDDFNSVSIDVLSCKIYIKKEPLVILGKEYKENPKLQCLKAFHKAGNISVHSMQDIQTESVVRFCFKEDNGAMYESDEELTLTWDLDARTLKPKGGIYETKLQKNENVFGVDSKIDGRNIFMMAVVE